MVESDDKRRTRINMISHLLSSIPYREVERPALRLPERAPRDARTYVPDYAATLWA